MVSITYIFIVYITLYIAVLYRNSQACMSSNGVYIDITAHDWAQAVESFELDYDFMHIYYWKFDHFF